MIGSRRQACKLKRSRMETGQPVRVLRHYPQALLRAGLPGERMDALVLAVNEIATNSIRHGGGTGVIRSWDEGSFLLFQVEDSGRIDAPLAGRRQPVLDQPGGRGLWLANQLCDLVQVRTFELGNVVRIHMAR